jgi:CheY-like chemotaxis protein
LVCQLLEGLGCEPIAFEGGQPCLDQLSQVRPELILLDLNLPGLSGIEVLEQLAADPRAADIPVVALSACEPRRPQAEALRRLGKRWVQKPLGMQELLQIVGSVDSLGLAVVKLPVH